MAPTFPLEMPDQPIGAVDFDLRKFVASNHLAGGKTQSIEMSYPRWYAKYQTDALSPNSPQDLQIIGQWEAFYDLLEGAKRFLAWDPAHEYPAAHPMGEGLSGWDGIANVSSIPTAYTLSFTSLFSGLQLKAGDLVSLVQGGKYSLHRISEDRAAGGTTLTNVYVQPYINTNLFSSSAVPYFVRPKCEMTPIADSFSAPKREQPAPITFKGIQVLY